jgi:hypothetical protein
VIISRGNDPIARLSRIRKDTDLDALIEEVRAAAAGSTRHFFSLMASTPAISPKPPAAAFRSPNPCNSHSIARSSRPRTCAA